MLILFLTVTAIAAILYLYWKVVAYEEELKLLRKFDHVIPAKSIIYFDNRTDRICKRCESGRIVWRERYRVVVVPEGGTTMKELTKIYWCNQCKFRGISLK